MATTKLSATVFAVVVVVALFQSSAAQTTHVVGDTVGWTIPPNATTYSTWAARQKFAVGDVLVFNYPTGAHTVAEVTKAAYDGCSSTSPITMVTTGPARITINASGDHYFICTFPGHCGFGQKLSINVPATAATPPPTPATSMPPAATPPPTPTTSMPPTASPPTPTTSMPPAASPPTPTTSMPPAATPTPTTGGSAPSPATTASPPSPSPTGAMPPSSTETPSPSPINTSTPAPSDGSPAPPQDNNSASTFAAVAALPAALLSIALVLLN